MFCFLFTFLNQRKVFVIEAPKKSADKPVTGVFNVQQINTNFQNRARPSHCQHGIWFIHIRKVTPAMTLCVLKCFWQFSIFPKITFPASGHRSHLPDQFLKAFAGVPEIISSLIFPSPTSATGSLSARPVHYLFWICLWKLLHEHNAGQAEIISHKTIWAPCSRPVTHPPPSPDNGY